MPKRIILQPHLGPAELEARYRQAKDPVERSHLQIVWLLARGKPTRVVAEHTGYSPLWIQQIARRYNADGPAGLGDRRKRNPGAAPLLDEGQRRELWAALHGPAPGGGLWTGRKVADWIAAQIGRPVRFQRGWEYLCTLGFSPQRPRPRHAKADPTAQAAFKKTSRAS